MYDCWLPVSSTICTNWDTCGPLELNAAALAVCNRMARSFWTQREVAGGVGVLAGAWGLIPALRSADGSVRGWLMVGVFVTRGGFTLGIPSFARISSFTTLRNRHFLQRSGRCFVHVFKGHISGNCCTNSRCMNCKRRHHISIRSTYNCELCEETTKARATTAALFSGNLTSGPTCCYCPQQHVSRLCEIVKWWRRRPDSICLHRPFCYLCPEIIFLFVKHLFRISIASCGSVNPEIDSRAVCSNKERR